jgi:DNA-binding transcriptional LysR family regulator
MHVAAEAKNISQPALTKSLKLLENEIGVPLFQRTPRGLEPTAAGTKLYQYACQIDQAARFAAIDLQQSLKKGHLNIGIGPVLAVSTFPPIITAFHRAYPGLSIKVETGISSQLIEGLARENYDFVVTALPEDPVPKTMTSFPLYKSHMVAIGRAGHPLASVGGRIEDLAGYRRVGFVEDREFEKRAKHALGSRAEAFRPAVQTTSVAVMFGVLAATDYFAIVSDMMLPRAMSEGLVKLPIEYDFWTLEHALICKTSLTSSLAVEAIRAALIASANGR